MSRKPYSKSMKNPEVRAVFEKMVGENAHYRDIMDAVGIRSTTTVFKYLKEYPDYSYKRRIDPDVTRRNQAKGIELRKKLRAEGKDWYKEPEGTRGYSKPRKEQGEYSTNHRYINGWAPMDHPLAKIAGHSTIHQHRIILFEKIGEGTHQCHWCEREIEWGPRGERCLEVDHINFDTHDNRPENLVPACMVCNRSRKSHMRKWSPKKV